MPPQIQALMQNKKMLAIIAGVLVLIIVAGIFFAVQSNSGHKVEKLTKEQLTLIKTKDTGKAIEIQALLAREGIRLDRNEKDGDSTLSFNEEATVEDRDRALITLVQSGLMDKNIGLEAFDKGDLTASREEKRIKLIRAQQGELARLIRKIKPIEDASVSISIPEQTMFRAQEKPISASVQVTIPNGDSLTRDKVRSIINLMVGSIQGLDAQHVALSDTNGTTYNSVLDTGSELNDKLAEQDQYMKQKVASQLDRLVGAGHYVVTVSTMLREAPKETLVQTYDPQHSTVSSKQTFTENLNTKSGSNGGGGPVSSFLPPGTTASGGGSSANKDYVRNGVEVSYANAKTQWVETSLPGMIEDISLAVTIDSDRFPSVPMNELQTLLAHAASPKVNPENVSIARVDFDRPTADLPLPQSEDGAEAQDMGWLIWALGAIGVCFVFILLLSLKKSGGGKVNMEGLEETTRELQYLRDLASQQQAQLQATQQQTQMLLEAQQRQAIQASEPVPAQIAQQATSQLQQTLSELREAVTNEDLADEDLELQIRSWIESS